MQSTTESPDSRRDTTTQEEVIPPRAALVAEALPHAPGEQMLTLTLTLAEVGAIAASLQTCVHSGWVRQPSDLNVINSVLRKIHDAKLVLVAGGTNEQSMPKEKA
jgi:hypothetical protein